MPFVREFETRIITEADNIWVGLENNPQSQVVGTLCTCRVRATESGKMRQMTITISPDEPIESENAKLLFEECYKSCEIGLKSDLAKLKQQLIKECMNGR